MSAPKLRDAQQSSRPATSTRRSTKNFIGSFFPLITRFAPRGNAFLLDGTAPSRRFKDGAWTAVSACFLASARLRAGQGCRRSCFRHFLNPPGMAPPQRNFGHKSATEESLRYAALCVFDRVLPPHPDALPQGEGTASVCLVFSRWLLGKLRHGCDGEAVDHSPSPQGEGRGEGEPSVAHPKVQSVRTPH